MADPAPVKLSIAICTHNPRVDLLNRVAEAIVREMRTRNDCELVIIDNNSSPPLALSIEDARIVFEGRPGLTAAREKAISSANGELLLFIDDDNVIKPGYLTGVVERFDSDLSLGLLGGAITPEYESTPPRWIEPYEDWLAIRRYPESFEHRTEQPPYSRFFPVGAGMAVRTELAREYVDDASNSTRIEGRIGKSLSSGEDTDLGLFVLSRGYALLVDGRLQMNHVIPPSRTTKAYLTRFAIGNTDSAALLAEKWAGRFEVPVFNEEESRFKWLKLLALLALSPFGFKYRIRFRVRWHLNVVRRLRAARRADAPAGTATQT